MQRTKKPGAAKEESKAKTAAATITRREVKKPDASRTFFPSGSTMLNCALADVAEAGIPTGKIVNIVADSGVGKTMLAETMLACICADTKYDEFDLVYDDAEHAFEMDTCRLFGEAAHDRIQAPWEGPDGAPLNSQTVEQWYAAVMDRIRKGRPFVYILDSVDALSDVAEYEQAVALGKAAEKAAAEGDLSTVKMEGSYGMAKAKLMSQILRTIKGDIAGTQSTVVIISQVRDNVGARPGQPTKKRACGKALEFYCTFTVWLNHLATLKGGKKTSEEIIGKRVEAKVTKNKVHGKLRAVKFDIYYDYGIDDTTSCVDFLAEQGVLKKSGAYINADALGYEKAMYKEDLVRAIEDDEIFPELYALVQKAWDEKEEGLRLNRKPRFR